MGEFSNRVHAQRRILNAVNGKSWPEEQLFALTLPAIQRFATANGLTTSCTLVQILNSASAQIFVMANNSEDPVAESYRLSSERIDHVARLIEKELSGPEETIL